MAAEDYRTRSYTTWEAAAPGWERGRAWIWDASRAVAEWMVARLDPQPRDTILELAAGPGDTGFLAAERLRDSGRLISTDFAPAMVDVARRRGQELGLTNVEYRVLDAESMDLEDASVDGVLCRWGYMLVADPAAALRETRRVLRTGGKLVFSVWADAARNPWASAAGRLLVARGHLPPPSPNQPGIFAMASPDRIAKLVTGAGFESPAIEELEVVWRYDGEDDYWAFLLDVAGGISMALAQLPDEERQEIRREMNAAVANYRAADGTLAMPGVCLNAVAS